MAAGPTQDPDAMTRRPTITNPILGAAPAVPAKKKSSAGPIVLLVILIAAAVWYFVGR
jgi:hypothetical protein